MGNSSVKTGTDIYFDKLGAYLGRPCKVLSDPIRWTIYVNGRPVSCRTPDLISPGKFREICFNRFGILLGRVSQNEWAEIINEVLQFGKNICTIPKLEVKRNGRR